MTQSLCPLTDDQKRARCDDIGGRDSDQTAQAEPGRDGNGGTDDSSDGQRGFGHQPVTTQQWDYREREHQQEGCDKQWWYAFGDLVKFVRDRSGRETEDGDVPELQFRHGCKSVQFPLVAGWMVRL